MIEFLDNRAKYIVDALRRTVGPGSMDVDATVELQKQLQLTLLTRGFVETQLQELGIQDRPFGIRRQPYVRKEEVQVIHDAWVMDLDSLPDDLRSHHERYGDTPLRQVLIDLRTEKGLNGAQLAEALHVDNTLVNKMERDPKRSISRGYAERFATLYSEEDFPGLGRYLVVRAHTEHEMRIAARKQVKAKQGSS